MNKIKMHPLFSSRYSKLLVDERRVYIQYSTYLLAQVSSRASFFLAAHLSSFSVLLIFLLLPGRLLRAELLKSASTALEGLVN